MRPGIYLYGGSAGPGTEPPETAVHVRARVVLARDVPGGATVGYGATYRSKGPERWAAAGIGYGDGLPRTLANRGIGTRGRAQGTGAGTDLHGYHGGKSRGRHIPR